MRADWFRRHRSLRIAPNDSVVEIGSGYDPCWRSDLLIDKYVADSSERPGGYASLLIDRPFIVGDAQWLPFSDKSIDFLIARNILEHIIDVDSFLEEMMRAGRRGYITTPSSLSEKLSGWKKHVWFVSIDDGILKLEAKEKALYDRQLSRIFHRLYEQDRAFRCFYQKNCHLFVVEYHWEDHIRYHVEGDPALLQAIKVTQAEFDLETTRAALAHRRRHGGIRQRAESLAHSLVSRNGIGRIDDIVTKLACPLCRGSLTITAPAVHCVHCGARYPSIVGVPILVREAADHG
jgi:uncharacterized protein YbaR (Trm112 family)